MESFFADPGNIAATGISIFRLLIPFTILRWPLTGALLAIVGDISDVMVMEQTGWGFYSNNRYHFLDKILDIWYLFFEFLIVRQWTDVLARKTGKMLFFWHTAGFALFEITHIREFFFLAPNIFENFYLAWTIIKKLHPKFVLTKTRLIIILLIVGIPKIIQEAIMHWILKDRTWAFLRDNLFWWLYE